MRHKLEILFNESTLINFNITNEFEHIIRQHIATGKNTSRDAVIHDALKLLEERDRHDRAGVNELRQRIAVGIEDVEQGRFTTYDESNLGTLLERVKERGLKKLEAPRSKTAAD